MKQHQQSLENIIQDQREPNQIENQLPFLSLFRFSDRTDYFLMALGAVCSIGAGCTAPLLVYLLTNFNPSFSSNDNDFKKSNAIQALLGFIYLGIGGLFCVWGMTSLWFITGERQASKCRIAYYESLLKQDIQFYDCNEQSQLHSKFSIDTLNYQGAIGQKCAVVIQVIGQFACTLVISFIQGWLLTFVLIAILPLIIFTMYFNLTTFQKREKSFLQAYSAAGGRVEEAITSIKTVKQFGAEDFNVELYKNHSKDTLEKKFQTLLKIALSFGILNGTIYIAYSLGFWFGSNCVIGSNHCPTNVSGGYYTTQNVQVIFFTFIMSCKTLSSFSPALKKISLGRQASKRIFSVIDRVAKINPNVGGLKLDNFEGKVQFRNVTFAYPKNPKRKILNNITISFDLESSALVGESGCGKSTIIQLLMRFYDPQEGQILIDSVDLKKIDLLWLRSKIGYVGQQPVLFATTIKENLLFANPKATEDDMKAALKQAEVYDFIFEQLEDKMDTFVGAGGSQVSGGQKQRIAIARALIKKPNILILDEATSALDRTNERLIQKTLNKVSENLKTITIAHRIETITNSKRIFVLENGTVQESGVFDEISYFKNARYAQYPLSAKSNQQVNKDFIDMEAQADKSNIRINLQQSDKQNKQIGYNQDQQNRQKILSSYNNKFNIRILSYCRNKKPALILAIILSCLAGIISPVFSIYIGKIISAMLDLQTNKNNQQSIDKLNTSSLSFLLIGIGALILYFSQNLLGYIAGDEIVANLREQTFKKILKMPMKWFDKRQNSSGSLCHCLSHSCENISELVTTSIFILIESLSNIIAGFTICFVYEWRVAFAAAGMFPFIVFCGVIRTRFKSNITKKTDETYKSKSGIIAQSLTNIRTVYAFNMEDTFSKHYSVSLQQPHAQLIKFGVFSGFMGGLGSVGVNVACGILLYIAIIIIINTGMGTQNIIISFFTYFFTGISVANNLVFMPDIATAKIAAVNLFTILDAEDEEQMQERQKSKMLKQGFKCNIRFEKISFKYESRQHYALNNLSLHIKEGQKIAFVGPSGCGKSTIMSLLLRFYEPQSGQIQIGGIDIKDFDIKYLRSQFGVVSQQPALFNTSYRENIRYNALTASEEDIRTACKQANGLAFIQGRQKVDQQSINDRQAEEYQGFDRIVGPKGLHISGGQKQRVAIARAILRNPRILLLDEATSALDAENQQIVQNSLNQLMKDRTTITVAHRIRTIEDSDVINVIDKGTIVEQGNYENLTTIKGFFYQLERGNKI